MQMIKGNGSLYTMQATAGCEALTITYISVTKKLSMVYLESENLTLGTWTEATKKIVLGGL